MSYRTFASALYEALRPDPFYAALEQVCGAQGSAREAMLRYYEASIQDAADWGRLGLPDTGGDAISVWAVPLSAEDSRARTAAKEAALADAMGPAGLDLFRAIEASMAESESVLDLEGYWYLSILGVHPDRQRQGLGAQVLAPVLDEADNAGVSSYLTTFTPRNIPFYERQGYRLVETFPEPVTRSEFSVLVRAPAV